MAKHFLFLSKNFIAIKKIQKNSSKTSEKNDKKSFLTKANINEEKKLVSLSMTISMCCASNQLLRCIIDTSTLLFNVRFCYLLFFVFSLSPACLLSFYPVSHICKLPFKRLPTEHAERKRKKQTTKIDSCSLLCRHMVIALIRFSNQYTNHTVCYAYSSVHTQLSLTKLQ